MGTYFESASHFTVQGFQLYNAKQITINNCRDTGTLTEVTPGNWCCTIPGGDLDFVQNWGTVVEGEMVDKNGTCSYMFGFRTPPVGVSRITGVKLVRSTHTVQITSPSLSHPGTKFTAVFYGGPDAQQAYEDDLCQYSALWNINFAKLFGITHWRLPALIFQSDMIPFSEFYEQQCHSPIARGFLSYQAVICLHQARDHLRYEGCKVPHFFDKHIWIQPTSGHACIGPPTPPSEHTFGLPYEMPGSSPANNVPLGLMGYKSEKTVMQHLDLHLKDDFLSWVLDWIDIWGSLPTSNLTSIPLSIGCVYLESKKQIIAQMQCRQKIHISGWSKCAANAPLLVVTSTGRARCSVNNMANNTQAMDPSYFCDITSSTFDNKYLSTAWLAQAGHVLHQLNLKDSANKYVFCERMGYNLVSETQISPMASFSAQEYYFFIEPIKITKINGVSHFSLHDPPFFWSSDSSGLFPMKEETQILLGLPLPKATLIGQWCCTRDTYDAVSAYLKLKGFDPFSLDYARSRNYPVFKIFDNVLNQDSDETRDIFDEPFPDFSVDPDPASGSESDSEDDIIYEYPSDEQILEHKASLAPLEYGILGCRQLSQPHYHIAECGTQKRQTRLRRTHSLSSFNREQKITEPLLVQVCAMRYHDLKSYDRYDPSAHKLLWDVQRSQKIPWKHIDCFLDHVDF